MKVAFFFEYLETRFFKAAKEAKRSFDSLRGLSCDAFGADRFILYDRVASRVVSSNPEWEAVACGEDGGRRVGQAFPATTRYFVPKFNPLASEYDVAVSVPSVWELEERLDVSRFVKTLCLFPEIAAIQLGGSPLEETDGHSPYSFDDSSVPMYRKLRTHFWSCPDLIGFHAPCVVNLKLVVKRATGGEMPVFRMPSNLNRCGFDDAFMNVFPNWIHTERGDGRPKLFSDLVGIRPQHWSKKETR